MVSAMVALTESKAMALISSVRGQIGKTLLNWLPNDNKATKPYLSAIHNSLSQILDDLNLRDLANPQDPKSPDEQAEAQFLLYFASIKNRLDQSETAADEMIPVLSALLKQNLSVGIRHCISMGFAEKSAVRAAFIGALAKIFKIPEQTVVYQDEAEEEQSLIDILSQDNFELMDFVGQIVPCTLR